MNCKDFQNNIVFFIDQELNKENATMFEDHLECCNQCKKLFEQVNLSYSLINDDRITESNPFFYSRVMTAVENKTQKTLFVNKKQVVQWATFAIIGLFAIVTGYLIANDKNYVLKDTLQNQYELTDEELFVDSHYLTLSTDDLYVVNSEETEE